MEGSRPGVMLYFETLQAIEELEAEDAKQIMSAILHYSRDGELPALRGPLAAVWSLIRSGLDRDKARYGEKQIRGIWLTYCRKCKSTGETPLAFDEWVSTQYDNDTLPYVERTVNSAVNVPSPTTSPSTTTTVRLITSSLTAPVATTTANAETGKELKNTVLHRPCQDVEAAMITLWQKISSLSSRLSVYTGRKSGLFSKPKN